MGDTVSTCSTCSTSQNDGKPENEVEYPKADELHLLHQNNEPSVNQNPNLIKPQKLPEPLPVSKLIRKVLPSGDYFTGVLTDKENGIGIGNIQFNNGDIYIGNITNFLPSDQGVLTFSNDDCYKGNFDQGMMSGFGEFEDSLGNKTSGNWVKN